VKTKRQLKAKAKNQLMTKAKSQLPSELTLIQCGEFKAAVPNGAAVFLYFGAAVFYLSVGF
jgi:hypothetical protein